MSINRPLCRWLYAIFFVLLGGCVVIPIPSFQDAVISGRAVAEGEVRSMVSPGEDANSVRTRLGSPTIDFGPRRVFVYHWAVNKGAVVWLLGGPGGAIGGIDPLSETNFLFVAFDTEGKVLDAGTVEFNSFETIGEQVRDWLSSVGLSSQVVGPSPGQSSSHRSLLLVYRPSTSPCSFPTFDSNIFKPSVAVDGIVVGDLAKGEYLSVEVEAGMSHEITIDPYPDYRVRGLEGSFFVHNLRTNRVPVTVNGLGDSTHPIYVETYLCTGNGKIVMHAKLKDAESALLAIRGLQPVW